MKPSSLLCDRGRSRGVVIALVAMWGGVCLAADRTPMQEALSSQLPKFDPEAATPKPRAAGQEEVKTRATLVRLPATAASAAPEYRPVTPEAPKEIVVLPQVTVTGKSGSPRSNTLPRLNVTRPVKDLPAVPFETGSARDARLVKKHLTAFDALFLNRFTLPFIGVSKETRAGQMEAVAANTTALNDIAEGIEFELWTGASSEEKKKLKDMYYDVYLKRTK